MMGFKNSIAMAVIFLSPLAAHADRQECTEKWIDADVDFSFTVRPWVRQANVTVVNQSSYSISKVRMTFAESGNVYDEEIYNGLQPRKSRTLDITVTAEDSTDGARASLIGLRKERDCRTVVTLSTGQTFDGKVSRLGAYDVNELKINHFRHTVDNLTQQYLELTGEIGPDSTFYVDSLLKKFSGQIDVIILNSRGGLVKDGLALASAINRHNVKAAVTIDANCASSCAIAFLGSKKRTMADGAKISFHSPYYQVGGRYKCTEVKELETLFTTQLGAESGSFAYQRMMDFCGPSQVWTLNADAADLIGLINNP